MARKLTLFGLFLHLASCISYGAEISSTNAVYFLVGGPGSGGSPPDSYVLPLSQPGDIEHARDLIIRGGSAAGRTIAVAHVARAKDSVNRNYVAVMCPAWSWQVVEFFGFADLTPEVLDGGPTLTEAEFQGTRPDYETDIGYWNYTVVRELGPEPICLCAKTNSTSLLLRWVGVSTNYFYTLESTSSLSNTNWTPVAGGPWPSKTNQWTVALPAVSNRFYRVKAELQP
jgi:hypothetical protein